MTTRNTESNARSERRKERYRLARSLGFSAAESRKLRDNSSEIIRTEISTVRRTLTDIPTRQRTAEQQQRLISVRRYERQRREDVTVRGAIETLDDRNEQWEEWSDRTTGRPFPAAIQRDIIRVNRDAGNPDFSSFGHRVMYAQYVLQMSVGESFGYASYEDDDFSDDGGDIDEF